MCDMRTRIDFCLEFCVEKKPAEGEDSYVYALGKQAGVVAVFDGCGGSGAKRYARAQHRSGAYLASRIAAGVVRDWFLSGDALHASDEAASQLEQRMGRMLFYCGNVLGESSRLRGTLAKELPSTCAVMVVRPAGDELEALCLWAGDSRCYLLDRGGLHQVSADDVEGYDALDNLTADGVLTNVLNASAEFSIHAALVPINESCIVLTATDGCFGYLPTPMEFEALLLNTLAESHNPTEWEDGLKKAIGAIAGDDATMCGFSMGFGDFKHLREILSARKELVNNHFVQGLPDAPAELVRERWDEYQVGYNSYFPNA